MKYVKKLVSSALALSLCCCIGAGSVNAASSYPKGDVNGDGLVSAADLATMIQFTKGFIGASGTAAERMDVYKDYVINGYDVDTLKKIFLGEITSTVVSSTNTTNLPAQTTRYYTKYNPVTGASMGSYSIGTVSNINSDGMTPRAVFPPDGRVPENGLKGVVNVQNSSGYNGGTAFVIGEHTLLTAAHVVYNTSNPKLNLKFKIFTDYDTESNVQITPTAYHIPNLYVSGPDSWKYDYAIVTVKEDLSDYINFDLGVMRDGLSEGRDLYVTGFGGNGLNADPDIVDKKSTGIGHLSDIYKSGSGYDHSYWDYAIFYDIDTTGGNSGSPVYVKNPDGSNTVIAIHNYGSTANHGTRITTDILKFVYNNPNL